MWPLVPMIKLCWQVQRAAKHLIGLCKCDTDGPPLRHMGPLCWLMFDFPSHHFSIYSFSSFCCILPSKVALYAAPYRSNFMQALSKGEDVKEEECLAKMQQFLVNYTPTVDAIYEMYSRLNAELDYTVWRQHHWTQAWVWVLEFPLFLFFVLFMWQCDIYYFNCITLTLIHFVYMIAKTTTLIK